MQILRVVRSGRSSTNMYQIQTRTHHRITCFLLHATRATTPLSLHTLAHSDALRCAVIWIGILMLAFGGFVAINELVLKTGNAPVIDLAAGALGAGSSKILINLPTTRAELVATVTDKQNDIDTYAWVMSEATKKAFAITGFQNEEFIKSPATASTWIDFGAAAVPGTFSFILTVKDSKSANCCFGGTGEMGKGGTGAGVGLSCCGSNEGSEGGRGGGRKRNECVESRQRGARRNNEE